MGALDEVSPVESVDNEGVQIVLPTNTLSEIRLELDEGAKGVKGSWIDAKVVDRLGLKKRPCEGQRRFRSRLLPGQTFTPKEEVSITLLIKPANVRVSLDALVLPRDDSGEEMSEIIVGNYDIERLGLRGLLAAEKALFEPAMPAPEVLNALSEHLKNGQMLEEMMGAIETEENGEELRKARCVWEKQLCIENLPLNSVWRKKFIRLLEKYEGSVIADKLDGSMAQVEPMQVDLKPGESFEGVRAVRYSQQKQKVIEEWLERMLKAGIIRRSNSTTTSPLLVVQDPSGKFRVTQNVSVLNSKMRTVHGSIPEIKRLIDKFTGLRYMGIFDLISAYHQLPAHETMRKLWAFSTHKGNYEYTDRLPMGDKNVCVHFNNAMMEILEGIDEAGVYFDDIPFGSKTLEGLYITTERILKRLKEKNVKISKEKLRLCYSNLDMLGYEVSETGYTPRQRNVEKFLQEPFPDTNGIRKWLGLLNVFSKFIPEHNEIKEAFRHAAQKGGTLLDNKDTRAAFETAKRAVAKIQQLYHLDEKKEIYLDTDASDYGIGGCLYHKDEEGQMQPILFTAHLLSESARKWSTKKKEAYAIFKTLEDMQYLLRGREFVLRTDHRNLLYLVGNTDQVEHRMLQFISEFSFTMEYVPGPENVVADALSRILSMNNIMTFGGINAKLVSEFYDRAHNVEVGHLGINKTVDAVRDIMVKEGKEVPKNLRGEVTELMSKCMLCKKLKGKLENPVLLPHGLHGGRFFERIQLDFLEGLPKLADGCNAILVIICTMSKFVLLFPVADKTAEVAKQCMLYSMALFGHPTIAVSDGGAAFKALEFECLMNYAEVDTMLTHPYRPSAHGVVERVHQEVMKHLSTIIHTVIEAEPTEWGAFVPWVQRIINNTESTATGYAPVTIVFGQEHVRDSNIMGFLAKTEVEDIKDYDAFVTKHNRVLSVIQKASNEHLDNRLLEKFRVLETSQESMAAPLEEGSYVLIRNPNPSKVSLKWTGPSRVLKAIGDNFYEIQDVTQDKKLAEHRDTLLRIPWIKNDEEAREHAQRDTNELTITEVVSHVGDAQRPSTVVFSCKCRQSEDIFQFAFANCKHVSVIKEYIDKDESLKDLKANVHYKALKIRKKSRKLLERSEA